MASYYMTRCKNCGREVKLQGPDSPPIVIAVVFCSVSCEASFLIKNPTAKNTERSSGTPPEQR